MRKFLTLLVLLPLFSCESNFVEPNQKDLQSDPIEDSESETEISGTPSKNPEIPEIIQKTMKYGDVDNDGIVSSIDALKTGNYIEGDDVGTFDIQAADVDGNGELNENDCLLIILYYTKIISYFPIENPDEFVYPDEEEYLFFPKNQVKYGDVDDDGDVNIIDAQKTAMYISGTEVIPFNETAADVNGDGNLTNEDCSLIAQYYTGSISIFPVEMQ